jgi:hypothetical protein
MKEKAMKNIKLFLLPLFIVMIIISKLAMAQYPITITEIESIPSIVKPKGGPYTGKYLLTSIPGQTVDFKNVFTPNTQQIIGGESGLCQLHHTLDSTGQCTIKLTFNPPNVNGVISEKIVVCIPGFSCVQRPFSVINDGGSLDANNIFFAEPGTQNLVLTNTYHSLTVTITNIVLDNHIYGVTIPATIDSKCKSISPSCNCSIPLTAAIDAHGSGNATVSYTVGSDPTIKTLIVDVSVPQTTVELYEIIDEPEPKRQVVVTSDIVLAQTGNPTICPLPQPGPAPITRTFAYKNRGNFTWVSPSLSWKLMFDDPCVPGEGSEDAVALDKNTCISTSNVAPGNQCTFQLSSFYDKPGDNGTLQVTGDNIATALRNVVAGGGLSIAINNDPKAYHLGYRSIVIQNTITDPKIGRNIRIDSVTVSGDNLLDISNPVVKYCAPDTTDCDGHNTTCSNITLAPGTLGTQGQNCLVWFKANDKKPDGTALPLQTVSDTLGKIRVEVSGSKEIKSDPDYVWEPFTAYEKECMFTASYNKSLYVGGHFTTAGGIPANRIAKWDGTEWSSLGIGMNSWVRRIVSIGSNLYVGGAFTVAGGISVNRIAKWDGTDWLPLGAGLDGSVSSIANIGSDLYVGGNFITAGRIPVNRIAKWDGTEWSPLGSGLDSPWQTSTTMDSDLYVGGNFITAGGISANNIAKWDGINWSPLGAGVNNSNWVYAITSVGSNLYVGGSFTTAGGISANRIAKWDGVEWSPLGSGVSAGALSSPVNSIVSVGSDLYAGGGFTTAGGISVNRIAKWDGVEWSPLGSGVNDAVNSIASVGSDLYTGGRFTTAGGISANRIAKWDGTNWLPLGLGLNDYIEFGGLTIAPALLITGYSWPLP